MPDRDFLDLAKACEAEAIGIVTEYIGKISGGALIPFNAMHNADVLLRIASRLRGIADTGPTANPAS